MNKTRPLIVSDKEKENCICQNVQTISYWNKYFVIHPHKCTLNNLRKKYQEQWENAYLRVKNARASRTLRWVLHPGQYWLTSLAQFYFATLAKSQKKILGSSDQILDLLVGIQASYLRGLQQLFMGFWSGTGSREWFGVIGCNAGGGCPQQTPVSC